MLDLFSFNNIDIYAESPHLRPLPKGRKIIDCRQGIIYQGSKRQISARLLQAMANSAPQATHFIDLFGGGGSMSLQALSNGYITHYNELDKGIFHLLHAIIKRIANNERSEFGILPTHYYDFISRERFKEIRDSDPQTDCDKTYKEFALLMYSFGCSRKAYFCHNDKEKFKQGGHNWVMFRDFKGAEVFKDFLANHSFIEVLDDLHKEFLQSTPNEYPKRRAEFFKIILKLEFIKCVNEFRQGFRDFFKPTLECIRNTKTIEMVDLCNKLAPDIPKKKYKVQRQAELNEARQLEYCQRIQRIQRIERIQQIQRIEQIQQIQRIQRIDSIAKSNIAFGNLSMSNLSYENVDLSAYSPHKTIIYCDPPYKDTRQEAYLDSSKQGGLDYEAFHNRLREWAAQGFSVFISEYNMPNDFECVLEIMKFSNMSPIKNRDQQERLERLFRLNYDMPF